MRYIASGPDKSIEETRNVLDRFIRHHEKYGFSKWAVELPPTGELIGDSGLLLLEGGPDFDLGYRLARVYWGNGFATECGQAWIEAAFSKLGLDRVVALAHPENAASIRIMIKLGMTYESPTCVHGMDCVLYSIRREGYTRPDD